MIQNYSPNFINNLLKNVKEGTWKVIWLL